MPFELEPRAPEQEKSGAETFREKWLCGKACQIRVRNAKRCEDDLRGCESVLVAVLNVPKGFGV
jgi:hypothetical protein